MRESVETYAPHRNSYPTSHSTNTPMKPENISLKSATAYTLLNSRENASELFHLADRSAVAGWTVDPARKQQTQQDLQQRLDKLKAEQQK